jgi:hypothetical protein
MKQYSGARSRFLDLDQSGRQNQIRRVDEKVF